MTFQVQKVEIEETAQAVDLVPLAWVIALVVRRWRRAQARRMVRQMAYAVGLIVERLEREPARIARATELRRLAKLERVRVRQLRDGEDAPRLSDADLKALKAADEVEGKAVKGKRGAPSIRAKAGRMRAAVGVGVMDRADARRADLRLVQTVELDAAREGVPADQVLEVKRGQRDKRLRTRDGLKLAHEKGTLTPKDGRASMLARIEADRLLAVGLRYRDRYEIAAASLRSCLDLSDRPPSSPSLYVQAKAAQRRAALANQVRVLDIAVSVRLGEDALLALRMVAGEARTINSITPSGRRRTRLARGLADALGIVAGVLDRGS